jgi:Icc-related predicted phosphoesterase
VYYLSDIHNDYHGINALLDIVGDVNAVLVVAGDINSKGRTVADLEAIADRWKAVIAVPGNHDWWGLALHETHKFNSNVDNVHVLLEDYVTIDDVTFCGTTLWHDIRSPLDEMVWRDNMNDVRKIRGYNYNRLSSGHIKNCHINSIEFIDKCQKTISGKKVLITHHAMSSKSIDSQYEGVNTNMFYFTNLEHLLEGFSYHIHGHIHQECDYYVSGCNVICNPRAYGSENSEYGTRIFDI